MNIYALQTAKAQDGLPSDGNTLIIPAVDSVHGHRPLWLINLMQAYKCERIKKTFCSTDHPLIKKAISSTVICGESLVSQSKSKDAPAKNSMNITRVAAIAFLFDTATKGTLE